MVCEHLSALEWLLLDERIAVTYRGQPWSKNCREWVYFDAALNVEELQRRLGLSAPVSVHDNSDPKSGIERGLYCSQCHDAIMGNPNASRSFP